MKIEELKAAIAQELDLAEYKINEEDRDRQLILESLIEHIREHLDTA